MPEYAKHKQVILSISSTFGYTVDFIRYEMSMVDVILAMDYIVENPPPGKIILALADSYSKGIASATRGKHRMSRLVRPKFRNDAERENWEKGQLNKMMCMFGNPVRRDKKPEYIDIPQTDEWVAMQKRAREKYGLK